MAAEAHPIARLRLQTRVSILIYVAFLPNPISRGHSPKTLVSCEPAFQVVAAGRVALPDGLRIIRTP